MNSSNYTKAEEAPPAPVMGVPLHQHHQQPPAGWQQEGPWSTGLCDCFEDAPNCCITCWCPCVTFGYVSEIVDQGATSCAVNGAIYGLLLYFTCCGCLFSWANRTKMRKSFGLQQSPCNDCCVHWCCDACALCQEYRELKNRGFDMTIGWEGNMQRQNNQRVAMAPSAPMVEDGMTR